MTWELALPIDWAVAGPGTIVAGGMLVVLLVDAIVRTRTWLGTGIPALLAVLGAGAELLRVGERPGFGDELGLVIVGASVLVLLVANVMNFENSMPPGEFHALLLASVAGGLIVVVAPDLVTFVVALELLTLPSVALVGLRRGDRRAAGAAWTYFLTSVTGTAILLMGVAVLYGLAGTLQFADIADALARHGVDPTVWAVPIVLIEVGVLVKLGAVPFHFWVPDTYRGASVVVAGFLAAVSKTAAVGAFVLLVLWLPGPELVLLGVAAATVTFGNLGALRQRDAVLMLAWSSVAHTGVLLATILPLGPALVPYAALYAGAATVAFTVLAVVLRTRGGTGVDELRGLLRTEPALGIPWVFALLTLAGFPPAVVGLVAKYAVLVDVFEVSRTMTLVLAVNVVIALGYYLHFIAVAVAKPDGEPYVSPSPPVSVRLAKVVALLGTLALVALSVWPAWLLTW